MSYTRPLAVLTATTVTFLLLGAGCQPQAGQACDHDGDFYTHSQNGKRTNLKCEFQPDTSGRGKPDQLRWVRA